MALPTSQPTNKVELVIFDCDGVLIDSEMLSAATLMQLLEEVGMPITIQEFRKDFLGRSFPSAAARFEERRGRSLPNGFSLEYRARLLARMEGNLKPMPGVTTVLQAMRIPICLATSSSPPRLAVSMEETALGQYFTGRMFTASEVANGKPAPDLMFHVAKAMGAAPGKCLVIEDSEMGLRSALAAGMTVWHYVGGGHLRDGFDLPEEVKPHRRLDSMPALHDAFREIGIAT